MIGLLVSIAVGAIVISLLLSPIETLGWWAGWYGHGLEDPREGAVGTPSPEAGPAPRHYILYLDGIANVGGGHHYHDVQGLSRRNRVRLSG